MVARATVFLLLGATALPSAAHAQATTADGRVTFERAFFTSFAPSTALDIVRRTPGFVLDEAEEELRRNGPVPPEEIRRMLEQVFAEHEAEQGVRRGTQGAA